MTITVQDQIVVKPGDIHRIEEMLTTGYLPGAAGRGLQLLSMQISPPVVTDENPLTLWIRWELADAGAFWAMRAQSGCPEVHAFWASVDAFCLSRRRTFLTGQTASQLPTAAESGGGTTGVTGYRETAQLVLCEGSDADALDADLPRAAKGLPGLELALLGRNLAPEYAAGHFTWDLRFTDRVAAEAATASAHWCEEVIPVLDRHCSAVHAFVLEHIDGGVRAPDIAQGVKRTAYFRLLPDVDPAVAARFERDLLEMPLHMPDIRNWRLSKAIPASWNRSDVPPWTYVWEQEFADLEGLTGPYMTHPHHWSHIDRWFDPESGDQIVDVQISHAFNLFEVGILAGELVVTQA